jgi:hypothetical protein
LKPLYQYRDIFIQVGKALDQAAAIGKLLGIENNTILTKNRFPHTNQARLNAYFG